MRFKVYGPYDIGVDKAHDGWIDKEDTDNFWENVVVPDNHKLPDACGVYLFGVSGTGKKGIAGKTLPWYAGKAEKLKFKTECFNFKNLYYYNSVLTNEYKGKGSPFLYLLARVEGENDEFSKPASKEQYWGLQFVEEMFIQLSLSANSDLLNKSTTKMARETSIRGFLNMTKKESASVREFKGVFGMRDRKPIDIVKYENTKFRYDVYGPHDVPMKNPNNVKERTIDAEQVEEMWSSLGKGQKPLNTTCGVYVVGMRIKGNTTPWYVGTAHDRSFEAKCFKSDIEKLKKIINSKKGAPVIYLLPRLREKKGDFEPSKPMKNKPADMDYVKRVLLEYGVQTNEEILFEDSRDAEILRGLYIEGFVNSQKGAGNKTAVKKLKQLLDK